MNAAKMQLMLHENSAFISSVLFKCKFHYTDEVELASTDGLDVRLNPDAFMDLQKEHQVYVLAQIGWHLGLMHPVRAVGKDPKIWNQAADIKVNDILKKEKYSIPKGVHTSSKYDDSWTTEQIYKDLLDNQQNKDDDNNGNGNGNGGSGSGNQFSDDIEDPKNKTKEEQQKAEAQLQNNVIEGAQIARMQGQKLAGNEIGELDRQMDNWLNPKQPWNVILRNYVNDFAKDDYSWTRPNRRYLTQDIILPGMHSEALGEIAVAIDTSGSVSQEEFNSFLTEVNAIKNMLEPKKTTVIDFDTRIQTVVHLTPDDSVADVPFKGGGGTNLQPVFDYYGEASNKPTFLIVFSDLYCRQMEEDPGYPVIWLCVDNPKAEVNFGEIIHYSTRDD